MQKNMKEQREERNGAGGEAGRKATVLEQMAAMGKILTV